MLISIGYAMTFHDLAPVPIVLCGDKCIGQQYPLLSASNKLTMPPLVVVADHDEIPHQKPPTNRNPTYGAGS
jgi:hypothetical protein